MKASTFLQFGVMLLLSCSTIMEASCQDTVIPIVGSGTIASADVWIELKELLSDCPENNPLFQRSNVEEIIKNGTYAFIESSSFSEQPFSSKIEYSRFYKLGNILTKKKLPNRQIVGSYDGKVTKFSYLVLKSKGMSVREFRRTIFRLGRQFNQESIILSSSGMVQLVFTTGLKAGRAYLGKGSQTTVNKNFSVIKCDCANDIDSRNLNEQYLVLGEYNLNRNFLSDMFEEFKDLCSK